MISSEITRTYCLGRQCRPTCRTTPSLLLEAQCRVLLTNCYP